VQLGRTNEAARLSALLESLSRPALIVDRRHRIRAVNEAFRARVAGPAPAEGGHCYELLHGRRRRCPPKAPGCPLDLCVETATPVPAVHSHFAGRRRRRERVLLRPLVESDGHVIACLATFEPVRPVAEAREGVRRSAAAVAAVRAQLPPLARGREAVLLVGEPGTGKASVARALHRLSRRRGPFDEHNACELTGHRLRALLERGAGGGTLYLSDVQAFGREAQDALWERLRRGARGRRLILGTDQDLAERAAAGVFRADLVARLAENTLRLPPLRARLDEMPAIAARLLREAEGPGRTLSPEALERLRQYPFPGNLDELVQAVSQASLMSTGPTVRVEDLPDKLSGGGS
jgi:two-component system response regulator HydG